MIKESPKTSIYDAKHLRYVHEDELQAYFIDMEKVVGFDLATHQMPPSLTQDEFCNDIVRFFPLLNVKGFIITKSKLNYCVPAMYYTLYFPWRSGAQSSGNVPLGQWYMGSNVGKSGKMTEELTEALYDFDKHPDKEERARFKQWLFECGISYSRDIFHGYTIDGPLVDNWEWVAKDK